MKYLFKCFLVGIFYCLAGNVYAAESQNLNISVGAAGIYSPTFIGARDYNLSLLPDVRVKYKDTFFASVAEGIGYNIIPRGFGQKGWKIGVLSRVDFGRQEDGKSIFTITGGTDKLYGMGDIDLSYEFGGFSDYSFGKTSSRMEIRQGFGGHNGLLIDYDIKYTSNYGRIIFSFGPNIKWAGKSYNQAYFGVNDFQSARTGLDKSEIGAGVASYGLGGFMMRSINSKTSVITFAKFDVLTDHIKHSSLIEKYGTGNNFTIGVGISHSLGL